MQNKVKIMGILNITPDSFYDGVEDISLSQNRKKIEKIKNANIVDVGCESSRPGAKQIPISLEIDRLDTFIPLMKDYSDKIFSIDTCKHEVALHAIKNGFTILNDITAGKSDLNFFSSASEHNCKIVLMHMKGTPDTMQDNPKYDSLIDTIISFFEERVEVALKEGIREENIILDPGIGFGKTILDNDEIIRNINRIKSTGFQVLVGISRKSFLQHNNDTPSDRLPATLGVTALLVNSGIDIIRVHDVNETISMLNSVERIVR